MAKLHPHEREALRDFARRPPLRQPGPPVLPVMEYLRALSSLPLSLRPSKPVRFNGNSWKL